MIQDLISFLDKSVVNFLAADTVVRMLEADGFSHLDTRDHWDIVPGGKYYITHNGSAVFAFIAGRKPLSPFRIICAHTDSPGFRVKPNCEMLSDGRMLRLNTEVYGGPILYTWFDRPLSLAGRVILRTDNPLRPRMVPLRFNRPICTIPHLAIHFNRAVNEGNPLSKQKDMLPVVGRLPEGEEPRGWLTRTIAAELGVDAADILDYDMSLYALEGACLVGAYNDFITSGRIDDLSMAHAALTAIRAARPDADDTRVMALFDNEETGSGTKQGAASPVLRSILERVNKALGGCHDHFLRGVAASFMISADNGHGLHPNYESKQDPTNHPILGNGPVIKSNANCKYMTDADSAAVFRGICERAGVPVQTFVNNSDIAGGSTLGNILTSQIELRGVDMGAPQWAMHSCRETAAVADHLYTLRAFTEFYNL